jgi:hypothetical protein
VQQKASVPLWLCPRRGPGAWGAQPPTVTPRVASAQSLTEAWPGPMSPRWGQLPPHPGQGSDSLSGPAGHLADQVTSDGQCLTSPNPGDPPKKYFYIFFFFFKSTVNKGRYIDRAGLCPWVTSGFVSAVARPRVPLSGDLVCWLGAPPHCR